MPRHFRIGDFVGYCRARKRREFCEFVFREYVCESLRIRSEGKAMGVSYHELVGVSVAGDCRSGDEIACDVITRAGLVVIDEPSGPDS